MAEYRCPTCSATFDTRRGLGVHHSRAHDERLPNRECGRCGEEFYSDYERKYCSEECLDTAVSFEGAANPNFDDALETTTCEICGETFEYYPSEKEGLYCPACVESRSWRNPPVITGTDHPRWNGGKRTVACAVCDDPVERHPSGFTGEVTVCSKECHKTWVSDRFTGPGHPNWRGGDTAPYGKGWNEVRRCALERDGYACVICDTDGEELGRNPDVHHLVPVRSFVESPVLTERDAHRLDNVVTLCPPCHRRAEFGHISVVELRWRAGIERW